MHGYHAVKAERNDAYMHTSILSAHTYTASSRRGSAEAGWQAFTPDEKYTATFFIVYNTQVYIQVF